MLVKRSEESKKVCEHTRSQDGAGVVVVEEVIATDKAKVVVVALPVEGVVGEHAAIVAVG